MLWTPKFLIRQLRLKSCEVIISKVPKSLSVEANSELSLPDWDTLNLSTQLTGKHTAPILHPYPKNLGLAGPLHFSLEVWINVNINVAWSHLALCNPMDYSLPGFSVHGILQARIVEWVAVPSSRGSSWPRDWTQVSCIAGRFFTSWAINVNASSLMKDDFISTEGIRDTRWQLWVIQEAAPLLSGCSPLLESDFIYLLDFGLCRVLEALELLTVTPV